MHTNLFVIGAGGHAKVVLDTLRCCGMSVDSLWDDDTSLVGTKILGFEVNAPVDLLQLRVSGHIAIGFAEHRRQLAKQIAEAGLSLETIIHPTAIVADSSFIAKGSFIAASSVIAPDSVLGGCVIVNHGAVVDHDCKVGAFSHIAPNATLGGGVEVGEECLIGSGAVILPGVSIASRVTVGAGAVVTKDVIHSDSKMMGIPAK